ncbi:MAG: formyltransferase family protein [Desulfobacca sp.]|uniref:formyltransferase family protein n=1 Tax=Desulfobacca sp. TaxID=2067990 RepID=UPI00404A0B5B
MFSFGWFSSGRGPGSIALLTTAHQKMQEGFVPGRIAYVFCDREPGETPAADRFHAVVRSLGLPLITLSSRSLREAIRRRENDIEARRREFDTQVWAKLAAYQTQVVVLAGYMLVLSPLLCAHLLALNLHPAVPGGPKGTWRQVMWQLMESEAAEAGAMLHLATPALDEGPPVTYCHFPVQGPGWEPLWQAYRDKRRQFSLAEIREREGDQEPLFARLRAAELAREFPLILVTLRDLAARTLVLTPAGVNQGGRLIPGGFDISAAVEAYLQGTS